MMSSLIYKEENLTYEHFSQKKITT